MTENPQHRSGEDEFVPAGDDQVAERLAAMTEEEAELIPAEIWRNAYQRCLIDNNATL